MVVVDGVSRVGVEANVQGWNAGKVLEGGEIAAATHCADLAAPYVQDALPRGRLVGGLDGGGGCVDDVVEYWCGGRLEVPPACSNVDVLLTS